MQGKAAAVDRYHHGDLRAALIAEALDAVERLGPDRLSLRQLALAVGVSPAAAYHHFKDKRMLLAAVVAEGYCDFTALMRQLSRGADEPKERLARLGLAYLRFALARPQLFRLMQGPAFLGTDLPADLLTARGESGALLSDCVRDCLPGAGDAQIKTAVAAAWSLVHGMATLCNDGRLDALLDTGDLESATAAITRQLDVSRVLDR